MRAPSRQAVWLTLLLFCALFWAVVVWAGVEAVS